MKAPTKTASGITGKPRVAAVPNKSSPSAGAAAHNDYEAQDDVRTLMRAHEIKSDPKRHARAKAHAKTQLGKMKAVATGGNSNVGPANNDAAGNMGV